MQQFACNARANMSNIRLKSEQWFVQSNGATLTPGNQPNWRVSGSMAAFTSPTSAAIHMHDLTGHVAGGI